MSGREVDSAGVHNKWCDYSDSRKHPRHHLHHLGDVVTTVNPKNRVVALTVECGLAGSAPLPVISMCRDDNGAIAIARLTWDQAEQLGRLLIDAARRYGS